MTPPFRPSQISVDAALAGATVLAVVTMLASAIGLKAQRQTSEAKPDVPAVLEVEIASDWTMGDEGIQWADDFEAAGPLSPRYHDVGSNGGAFGPSDAIGVGGSRGLKQHYDSAQVNAGWAWRFFGDHPSVRGTQYREVWSRFYHRFDTGFVGVPPKMARMGSFARGDWTLAFMAHYWWGTRGSNRGRTVADVASNIAVDGNQPVQPGYNNFARWLPVGLSDFNVDTIPNRERWICYEMRVKLNDASMSNGEYDYWADGRKIISITGRNIVAGYATTGINAMQLDTYWNDGSPRAQDRFYDHLVVATHRIGPARSPRSPTIRKTPHRAADGSQQASWQIEIASATAVDSIIWTSRAITASGDVVRVNATTGTFAGEREGGVADTSESCARTNLN